jgi:hypothetical protein
MRDSTQDLCFGRKSLPTAAADSGTADLKCHKTLDADLLRNVDVAHSTRRQSSDDLEVRYAGPKFQARGLGLFGIRGGSNEGKQAVQKVSNFGTCPIAVM